MYKAKLSGSVRINGKDFRYDAGKLFDEPKGTLDEDIFEWIVPKQEREPVVTPKKVTKKPVKRTRKKVVKKKNA